MASRVGELPTGPVRASTAAPSRRRPFTLAPPMVWIIAIPSAALLAIYCVWYSANEPEMDFQVYRMGGRHILGSGLYSSQIEVLGRHLSFTYPPLAALLFWPISHLSVFAGQVLWDAINLAALIALIAVSIAAARSGRLGSSDWRTALALLLPVALLLYPVRSDLALGQINIVLILMIVVDLTTELSWRGHSFPHGVLVGLAAAIKLTPLVFIPYLVVSRQWRAAGNATLSFILVTGALFAISPRRVVGVLHQGRLRRAAGGQQSHRWESGAPRSHHQGASLAFVGALRPHRSRRALWRPGSCRGGIPTLLPVAGGAGLCGDGPPALSHFLAPSLRLDCARADLAGSWHGPAGEGCVVGPRRCPDLRGGPAHCGCGLRSVVVRAR